MDQMNRYDEILQIFESQKKEISKLSFKVNELEKTNTFLITILEKSQTLPPIYHPNLLQKDKAAAIEKEYSLKSLREKHSYVDSTHCETTLNDSYDGNLVANNNRNSFRWSTESSNNRNSCSHDFRHETTVKPSQNVSISGDMSAENDENKYQSFKSNNLNLRASHTSPVRRNQSQTNFTLCSDKKIISPAVSRDYSSDNKTSNTDDSENERDAPFNTNVTSASEMKVVTNHSPFVDKNGLPNLFPKIIDRESSLSGTPSSITNTMVSRSGDNENLKRAVDNLIETLQESTKATDTDRSSNNLQISQDNAKLKTDLNYSNYVTELLSYKDQYISDLNDKHTQMKLLLTTQQLKADLLHQTLIKNNDMIFRNIPNSSERNSSNVRSEPVSKMPGTPIEDIVSTMPSSANDLKQYRQKELSRLNNKYGEKTLDPLVKTGFVKFTALVKGYIVRTLCETNKVQNIIMTIKDTAQLAIKLRQERLSGDCIQSEECNANSLVTRRNNQELISFQQRLVFQIKTTLCELHEIFFEWPSALQMTLIRNHINKLMTSETKSLQQNKEVNFNEPSTSTTLKTKTVAKLSLATLNRRKKLAQRSAGTKENGDENSRTYTTPRKSTYISQYGCRGYVVGANSGTSNSQSKNACDRKPRTHNVTRRRGQTRTIIKSGINKSPSNTKSNSDAIMDKSPQTGQEDVNKTVPNIVNKFPKPANVQSAGQHQQQSPRQQQQEFVRTDHHHITNLSTQPSTPGKTITSTTCPPRSNNHIPCKNNLFNAKSNGNHHFYKSITTDGDSADDTFNSHKFPISPGPVQEFFNNDCDKLDWRSQTYTLSENNILCGDNPKTDVTELGSEKHSVNGDISNKSLFSDVNKNSISRVEVDINDNDLGYLCQNNSHFNDCNDSRESPNVVVDMTEPNKTPFANIHLNPINGTLTNHSLQSSLSNKPTSRNFSFSKNPSKPKTNNIVLSNALNLLKPDYYLSTATTTNNNNIYSANQTEFKIRKRIVACSSIYSSTVSHN